VARFPAARPEPKRAGDRRRMIRTASRTTLSDQISICRYFTGENSIKLSQLFFEGHAFGLFGSELTFGGHLLNLALLRLSCPCLHLRCPLGDYHFRELRIALVGSDLFF